MIAHHRDKKGRIDMKKKNKHQNSGGEVTELARETAKVEQYWIVGDRPEPRKPPKNYNYVEELINLQIELIKLQEYVRHNRLKMCVIFEGRDAAGKARKKIRHFAVLRKLLRCLYIAPHVSKVNLRKIYLLLL